jgi:hypothetical protein
MHVGPATKVNFPMTWRREVTPIKVRDQLTDLDSLRAMLDRAGIVFTEDKPARDEVAVVLSVEAGRGPRNDGYPHFCSELDFDETGSLIRWATWE